MAAKTPDENSRLPAEVSFELFRKRVLADNTLPETVRVAVTQCADNGGLLAAFTKAVSEIDAA